MSSRIPNEKIVLRLKHIVSSENLSVSDEALNEIARISDGGMRDSIGILDQLTTYTTEKITINDVHDINGTLSEIEIKEFIEDNV